MRVGRIEREEGDILSRGPESDKPKKAPVENIIDRTKGSIVADEILLEKLTRAHRRNELSDFFREYYNEILHTLVYGKKKYGTAVKVKELLTRVVENGQTQYSSEIFRLLEGEFTIDARTALKKVLESTENTPDTVKKSQTAKERKSYWELIFEKITESAHPLFTRLRAFLENDVVPKDISLQSAFERLREPTKRYALFRDLTDFRHEIVFGTGELALRQRALDDLFSFLTHGESLLSGAEQIAFHEFYARVGSALAYINEQTFTEVQPKEDARMEMRQAYAGKVETLRTVFRGIRDRRADMPAGWENSEGAKHFLIHTLKKASISEGDALSAIAEGLESEGWLHKLPCCDGEKFFCTLIALEELGFLYSEIAAGRAAPRDTVSLVAHVKHLVYERLLGRVRGERKRDTLPFSIREIDPLKEAQELEKSIQKKFEEGKRPGNAEVNELLLLIAWVESNGQTYPLSLKERQALIARAEKSTTGLQEEAERKRKEIVLDTPALQWSILDALHAKDLLNVLEELNLKQKYEKYVTQIANELGRSKDAIAKNLIVMQEFIEKVLHPNERKHLLESALRKRDPELLLSALQTAKREADFYRTEIFQKDSDIGSYLRTACTYRQLEMVAKHDGEVTLASWLTKKAPRNAAALDTLLKSKPYAQFLPSRKELASNQEYSARRERRREGFLTSEAPLLHTEEDGGYLEELRRIRSENITDEEKAERIASLNERYDRSNQARRSVHADIISEQAEMLTHALEANIRFRAREIKERYGTAFEDAFQRDKESITDLDWQSILATCPLEGLSELEHIDLQSGDPTSRAHHAIEELRRLARDVENVVSEAREHTEHLRKVRKIAAALLQHPTVQEKVSPEVLNQLRECAREDSPIGPTAQKSLLTLQHPEDFVRAYGENRKVSEALDALTNRTREIKTLLKMRAKVWSDVKSALALYQPEKAEDLELSSILGDLIEGKHLQVIDSNLEKAKQQNIDEERGRGLLAGVRVELERLQVFADGVRRLVTLQPEIMEDEAFQAFCRERKLRGDEWGVFDPENGGRIILRESKASDPKMHEALMIEEKAHGLDTLVTQYLSPRFFRDTYDTIINGNTPVRIKALFSERAQVWVGEKPALTSEEYHQWRHEVGRELWAKRRLFYASGGMDLEDEDVHIPLSSEDIAFFRALHQAKITTLPRNEKNWYPRLLIAAASKRRSASTPHTFVAHAGEGVGEGNGMRVMSDPLEEDGEGEEEREMSEERENREPPRNGYNEGVKMHENLDDIARRIYKIKKFLEAYPEQNTAEAKETVQHYRDEYEKLNEEYRRNPSPETDESLERRIKECKDALEKLTDEIDRFDTSEQDLREVKVRSLFLKALWHNVEYMSLYDVWQIFKSIGEDVKRQYVRRQQGRIGRVGESVTKWIPDWVPYLNILHGEFNRRKQQAELTEVEEWKKALKNMDAYALQDMLAHPANADQMKAIFELLSEQGRIVWEDERMWKALSNFSRYEIPIDKCKRNENLQGEWLRKVIADIWEDKDLYRKWNTTNDHSFADHKKKFEHEADRLSNLSGGLSNELEKQLRIFVQTKEKRRVTGEHIPMPDDVQPHIYEEIIHYSIVNGKMSMEQKMYYLVQGIATGLLSADRLRALAGSEGELLLIFPFIDYFYHQNNTIEELEALSERLRESHDMNAPDYFKPGLKTTIWLEYEVSRNPQVQIRLRKGTDRKAGAMDHDDMHFFIPRMDYDTITRMATPEGGGRQKMSGDGWRNGYLGYNSFFKSFAFLAKMQEEGLDAKFTTDDAYQVMKAVAGFVRMDGILTKRSKYEDTGSRRPSIPWSEMKNSKAVNGYNTTVHQDRGAVYQFVRELITEYMDENIDREFIEDLMRSTEDGKASTDAQGNASYTASQNFPAFFEKAVKSKGTEKMKNILKRHMEKFSVTDSAREYDYEHVKDLYLEMQRHKREFALKA